MDGDGTGARVGTDGGSTAVDGAVHVMLVDRPLDRDGLSSVNGAGAGAGVEDVVGGVPQREVDGAGASVELPIRGGLAAGFDAAGACARFESAREAAEVDGAGAGLGADVAACGLQELNIAGAGLEVRGAVDTLGTDRTGARPGFEGGAYVLNLDIAGASVGADVGGAGKGDVVVDGDVAEEVVRVRFADGDVAAVLGDGWIVGNLLGAGFAVAAQP